ncbi:ribonuclease P protein component [Elioraea rosea]|uniref:ribonuclease P protein component n=1 Tax=Elioraea rosea TaxID=2492390 RepID=UPI001184BD85|nr:ribonuclease P protein component [Elioraea rosea]
MAAGRPPGETRLRRRSEFLVVAAKGRKSAMPGVVVQALAVPDQAGVRLGFTCSRKVGNAVARNRARRRLREAARAVLPPSLAGWDLVLIGRPATVERTFADLVSDLSAAVKRLGVT